MPEDKPVIVDTNIVFSALLKSRSSFMDYLLTAPKKFYIHPNPHAPEAKA